MSGHPYPPITDFSGLSPEVISGRLYAGAGDGPLLAAAAVWDRLAGAWGSALRSYRAVVAELTDGPWRGAAAASMAEAAQQYAAWMQTIADGAEQTANRLRVAAAVYRQAFAAVVPPSVVAANRSELSSLVAGNVFGQNAGLIAANQAEYAQMSAQDVAAMYDYAAGSAAATTLPSFSAPPNITAGAAGQTQAAQATPADPSNPLLDFLNSDPIQAFETFYGGTNQFFQSVGDLTLLPAGINLDAGMGIQAAIYGSQAFAGATGLQPAFSGIASSVYPFLAIPAASSVSANAAAPGLTASHAAGGAVVSAGMGRATPIGALAVPPSWTTTSAGLRLAAAATAQGGLPGWTGSAEAGQPVSGGWTGGIPPVAGLVNAPAAGTPRLHSGPAFQAIPRIAREGTADADAAPGRVSPHGVRVATTDPGDGESTEIAELRHLVAELTGRRDAATQLIRDAIDT